MRSAVRAIRAMAAWAFLFSNLSAADCRTLPLPGGFKEDGMWSALYAAGNGMVYIGAQAHGAEAHFYQYNPKEGAIRHLADMSELAGEKAKGIRIQAKIHTRFVEDKDGLIYFGTGNQGSGPWNIDPRSWSGGHWWLYNPARDEVRDLGLVAPGNSDLYGLAYDAVRHRLYGTAFNGHFYIFDIQTRTTVDAGRVNDWDVCRTIVTDHEGNCYGSFERHLLFKYDAAANRLIDLPITLPHDPFQWPGDPVRPKLDRKDIWRVAQWSPRDQVIYGVEGGASFLFRFNPRQGRYGEIRELAQLTPLHLAGRHDLGYATLSMTLSNDNLIYYAPGSAAFDYSGSEGTVEDMASYLISFNPADGQRRDFGKLVDEKNRLRVLGTNAAACGPDGTLYFFGAVEEKDPNAAAGKMKGKLPFALRLIIVEPAKLRIEK